MPLSDIAIRAAKPRPKPYKLTDEKGLCLQVNPDGSRWWRLRYRFHGREKMLSLGVYPEVSLRRAREKRSEARQMLDKGTDPSADRKAKRAGYENTFRAISAEWLAKQTDMEEASTRRRAQSWLDVVNRKIGSQPITDLTIDDLASIIDSFSAKGRHDTAHRIRALCDRVFVYAIKKRLVTRNIAADLRGTLAKAVKKNFPTITEPARVGEVLTAIDGYSGQATTLYALQLLPLVFVRPGELRGARWSEFTFDLEDPTDLEERKKRPDPVWRIPPDRMKMGTEHLVPLSRQAVAILRTAYALTGDCELAFPGIRSPSRPMSENTLNAALRNLGIGQDELVSHGFRSMASTLLNEQGWHPDLIELQLAHVERNKVRGAYNKALRLAERRTMMQAWADYLDGLKAGGNVVAIRAKTA